MGTDDQARDIFSRIVFGSRITLLVVALVAIIATPIGLLIGTTAGYFGGWTDTVLMRITDIFLAFPRLILALAFVAALGPGIENAIIAIAITAWPPYARLARAETLTIRDADHIDAIRLQGASAAADHLGPRRAALPLLGDRARHPRHGRHHPDRGGPRLPRPRRPAAAARMGGDDRRRPAVPDRLLVGRDHARASPSSSSRSASTCSATACATCSTRRRGDDRRCSRSRTCAIAFPIRDRHGRGRARRQLHASAASASASSARAARASR